MDDKRDYSELEGIGEELFTDFRTHSTPEESKARSEQKERFVVHIDDRFSDSMDYDFSSFSSPEDRAKEERRKEIARQTIDRLENEFAVIDDGSEEKYSGRVNVPVSDRRSPRYSHGEGNAFSGRPQGGETDTQSRMASMLRKPKQAIAPSEGNSSEQVVEKKTTVPVQSRRNPPRSASQLQGESQTPPEEHTGEETEKRVVHMRTRSASRVLSGFAVFFALVFLFTFSFSALGLSTIGDILAYNRDSVSVNVVLEASDDSTSPSLDDVLDCLHDAGLIKQKWFCKLFAQFRSYDGYTDKNGKFHPVEFLSGVYYLEPTLGLEGMLDAVKVSTTVTDDTITLTFPEGWTINQIFERLEKNGVCESEKLKANLSTVAKQYDFYFDIDVTDVRYLGVEGYLFPDTYEFYKNENAVSVLRKLFSNSQAKWTKEYESKAKALGYTRDEVLTVASIIQREAANQSQMADIASVLYNRLNSYTYPSLQCNSTSDYITKYVKPYVTDSYAQIYAEAYNTYKIEGLPPGPICNPGIEAIEATLNPNNTTFYFFVHNNNGKIYLSSTYDQFQIDCVQVAKDNAS